MSAYLTISGCSEAKYTEKMSRFLAFAYPVTDADEAKAIISRFRNEYHDARHVCWAYMIGSARSNFQSSDDGEPSGTAGKPILGQINSFGLTDILIIVVRYFGGIKLGTSGLIAAYREAARQALENAQTVERHTMTTISFTFPYLAMNDVMRITKSGNIKIMAQDFDNSCAMTISVRDDDASDFKHRLENVDGVILSD